MAFLLGGSFLLVLKSWPRSFKGGNARVGAFDGHRQRLGEGVWDLLVRVVRVTETRARLRVWT